MKQVLFSLLLSIIPAVFWFWFLILSKKEIKSLSVKLFLKLFLSGAALGATAMLIETRMSEFVTWPYLSFLKDSHGIIDLKELIFIFILTFIFIAPLEELLKYFFLKRAIFRGTEAKRAVDGVQLGIILSLGFATLENGFYFFQEPGIVGGLFVLRFSISTLAHVLYGGILGYYLVLAKFHRLYQGFFVRTGLIAVILLHGFFDFSLLTQAFYYNVGMVIIIFFVLMKWMIERRDFEMFIIKKKSPVSAPLFAKKQEIDAFLTEGQFSFTEIKSLSFCPRCLAIKKIGQKTCPYCKMKFE